MKKFIFSVLCVSVFFIGLGELVEKAGARFKSDERALGLIAQARQAIGGDSAVGSIRSMSITGKATKTLDVNGAARQETGDFEINMQLPDKFSRMMKLRHDGEEGQKFEKKIVDVIVSTNEPGEAKVVVDSDGSGETVKQVIKMKKTEADGPDGAKNDVVFIRKPGEGGTWTSENGETRTMIVKADGHSEGKGIAHGAGMGAHHQNEMLRTSIALLLSAPEGVDVGYTYGGEDTVDGSACDVINVEGMGSSFKLYLDKSSHLPKMVSYQAIKPMIFTFTTRDGEAKGIGAGAGSPQIVTVRTKGGEATATAGGETKVFERRAPEMAQYQIKFSDFRNVNGVQLPYRWTQTVGGKDDEVIDISGYEVNPANIADKFKDQKVFIRTRKPEGQQ